LRRRAIALNTLLDAVDHIASPPTRYTTKLLGQKKMPGLMSFDATLGGLALRLAEMPARA
jgi:hypothetical protein